MHRFTRAPIAIRRVVGTIHITVHAPSIYGHRPAQIRVVASTRLVGGTVPLRNKFHKCPVPPTLILVANSGRAVVGRSRHGRYCASNKLFNVSLLLTLRRRRVTTYPLGAVLPVGHSRTAHRLLRVPSDRFLIVCVTINRFHSRIGAYGSRHFDTSRVIAMRT